MLFRLVKNFFYELWDEVSDFFEDYLEFILRKDDLRKHEPKQANIYGKIMLVKPAYIFAERLDNFLKVVFGLSITFSAISATFVGFIKLSDLLDLLISNFIGRGLMIIIGISYLLLGLWKLINLDRK